MLKALILFFLDAKPTHGYEIQKYIRMNRIDRWTRIHSGSIYYALSKMERDGLIVLDREEEAGGRLRKVYRITAEGRAALQRYLREELAKPLQEPGVDKFLLNPLAGLVEREEAEKSLGEHLAALRRRRRTVEGWRARKVGPETSRLERLSIEMMLSSLDRQIEWHEALLEDLDECRRMSGRLREVIRSVDFSGLESLPESGEATEREVEALKEAILADPEHAAEKLNRLIALLEDEE